MYVIMLLLSLILGKPTERPHDAFLRGCVIGRITMYALGTGQDVERWTQAEKDEFIAANTIPCEEFYQLSKG